MPIDLFSLKSQELNKMVRKALGKVYSLFKKQEPGAQFKKASYAQSGEDLIVEFIFQLRKIENPSYIDIGAFHPYYMSNTAIFNKKGSKGINIEPNPDSILLFEKERPGDINLNVGIGSIQGEMTYFMMNEAPMNSFDRENALNLENNFGFRIIGERKILIERLDSVLKKYADNKFPDFLSLDVEGLDMEVLSQIDYKSNCPKVICVETIAYGTGEKNDQLIRFLLGSGYFIYADTTINTIFVNSSFWEKKT
jgi:FkbM family methyltransferase